MWPLSRRYGMVWLGLVLVLPAAWTPAQTPSENQPDQMTPLASKEQMIRDRFQRFRDRVYRLREKLAEVEPENAERLGRVLEREGEFELADRLEQIVKLLGEPSTMTEAMEAQAKWTQDVDQLLGILLERDSHNEERERELDRLEAYKKELKRLVEKERALRDGSAKATVAKRLSQQLSQAIQRVDSLLRRQSALGKQTGKSQGKSQAGLAREASQLGDELKRLAELKPKDSADSPKVKAARQEAKSASKSIQKAAHSMSQASKAIKGGQSGPASQRQQEAQRALEEARKLLEQAKKELEEMQRNAAQAAPQRRVAEDTRSLSKQMKQGAMPGDHAGQKGQNGQKGQQGQQGKQSQNGQQGQSGQKGQKGQQSQKGQKGQQGQKGQKGQQKDSSDSGAPTPGQQNLDQAQREMENAAKSLDQKKHAEAAQRQQRAVEKLEQAQQELEEVLSQLRQEDRAEMLRDIEERLRAMLAEQRAINAATETIDKVGRLSFQRTQKLRLAGLASQERGLSKKASSCVHILDEEGTTLVFPRIVGQVKADMEAVADRLAAWHAGRLTQSMEAEIVETLEQLVEAVKKMQQENEQQAGSQMQGREDDNKSLLPLSAELRLLRSSQQRINTRTIAIDGAKGEEEKVDSLLKKAIVETTARQAECEEIAKEIRDRKVEP